MTEKGFEVLKCLLGNGHRSQIEAVVASPDKNLTRDFYQEISGLCKSHGIPVFERKDEPAIGDSIVQLAIGWRWLIKTRGEKELIVIHDSLLPRYRGFAPLVAQLINGEKETGATMLFASSDYDEGDIIHQVRKSISYPLRIQEAINIMCGIYCDLALLLFNELKKGKVPASEPQDNNQASYSLWRDENDYRINWSDEAGRINRLIDATGDPYPGAFTFLGDQKIRIVASEQIADVNIEIRQPGKVIFVRNNCPVIVCGKGLLMITAAETYHEGKNVLPFKNFRTQLQ